MNETALRDTSLVLSVPTLYALLSSYHSSVVLRLRLNRHAIYVHV